MPDTHGAAAIGQQPEPAQQPKPAKAEIRYPPHLPKAQHAAYRRFLELREQNRRDEQDLARNYGAALQHSAIVEHRLSALMDMIWPPDTPEGVTRQVEHDIRYQERLAAQWDKLRSEVIQARLQMGGMLSPEEQKLLQSQAPGIFGNGQH